MKHRYYKSPSKSEGLFAILSETAEKFFVITNKNSTGTLENNKLTRSRLIEINSYEYTFNKEIRDLLIKEIKRYINNSDMFYRRKTLNRLLNDIEELERMDGE